MPTAERVCPGQLLNSKAADRPADHQLLYLLGAFEDVHGLPNRSSHFTRVRDLRCRPPASVGSTRFRRVLVPGVVPTTAACFAHERLVSE